MKVAYFIKVRILICFFTIIISNIGLIRTKMNFLDVDLLENLLKDPDSLDESSITTQHGGFQIRGNSIFHMYSLNADKLSLLIKYFTETNIQVLKAIMVKNLEGKTPLDIAISQDNQKTMDLMLKAISNFKELIYSRQFYKDIPKLISKGQSSFLGYLETCTFQTVQMKNMEFLHLPNQNSKVLTTHSHSSCILDSYFLSKEQILTNNLSESENNEYFEKNRELYDRIQDLRRSKHQVQKELEHVDEQYQQHKRKT